MSKRFSPMTVAEIIDTFVPSPNPFRWEAFDGSATGPADAQFTVKINNLQGLAYIATHPGDVGFARAYVTDGITVEGEHPAHPYGIFDALHAMYDKFTRPDAKTLARVARSLASMGAFQIQPVPEVERASWLRRKLHEGLSKHSKERDADVISDHYDVGNDFYELFLGDSMTYTCAYYPSPDATLDEAQENKYRLIFDKLRLKEGDRHLDVGCGWGGMVRYAAKRGVKSLGVTLSKEQAEWGQAKIKEEGLEDLAEIRFMDYRDVTEEGFDAISAIGLLEHIGVKNYPDFFSFLNGKLKPGGLMLNHCITYPDNHKTPKGGFIDRYIFPDGELSGSGTITKCMQDHSSPWYSMPTVSGPCSTARCSSSARATPAASSPARPTMGKACSWMTTGMSASVPTARTVWRKLTAHTGSRSSAAPESGTLMGVHRAIGPVPTRTSKASGASASRSHRRVVGINAPSCSGSGLRCSSCARCAAPRSSASSRSALRWRR
ncbi:class I SAM-dependent methyltransferase [Corynebacterium hesseae]|uniref:class I SAM-dependent methyltransferase n=1 Tax=Corynebacterium hesseae TaxID=2913502 RepID=UPI00373E3F20